MILEEGWEGGNSEKRTGLGPWGLVCGRKPKGAWVGVDSGGSNLVIQLVGSEGKLHIVVGP